MVSIKSLNKQNQVAAQVKQYLLWVEITALGGDINIYLSSHISDVKYENLEIDATVSTHRTHLIPRVLPQNAGFASTDKMEVAFKQMKAVTAEDVVMAYPDHNILFDIYINDSDY